MIVRWRSNFVDSGNWDAVLSLIDQARKEDGTLELTNDAVKYGEAFRLSIEIDAGANLFVPIKTMPGKDNLLDVTLLYYNNLESHGREIDFLGGEVSDVFVIGDFDVVMSMIKEFCETGDVKAIKYIGNIRIGPDDDDEDDFDFDAYFDEIDNSK